MNTSTLFQIENFYSAETIPLQLLLAGAIAVTVYGMYVINLGESTAIDLLNLVFIFIITGSVVVIVAIKSCIHKYHRQFQKTSYNMCFADTVLNALIMLIIMLSYPALRSTWYIIVYLVCYPGACIFLFVKNSQLK